MNKILLSFLLSSTLLLSSCGGNSATSATPSEEEIDASSSVEVTPSEESSLSSAPAEWVDYVHDSPVRLKLDYKGHVFAKDGIEQVSLRVAIDGDTAHFDPLSGGDPIKARFYGIDTPESTGKIQEYGIPASNYTKSILKEADKNGTIVVSTARSDYGLPKPDSTGSRYVSLVWVNTEKKNAGIDELYLLNLSIVQEGLSWVKNVADVPEYSETFYAAEAQAKAYKLNLFSGVPDELMPHGDFILTSLLDLKHEVVECIKDPNHKNAFDGTKVMIQGTVAGYSGNILFLQDYFPALDEEGKEIEGAEGEYAGINIFTGMGGISSDYTTRGTYIQVCGYALDSENFGFQISGCKFLDFPMNDTDAKVIYYPEENDAHALYTAKFTAEELSVAVGNQDCSFLYCAVNITDTFTVTRGYTSSDKNITLQIGKNWQIYLTSVYSPSEGVFWNSHEFFVGKTFTMKGVLTLFKNSSGRYAFQMVPSANADLVLVSE